MINVLVRRGNLETDTQRKDYVEMEKMSSTSQKEAQGDPSLTALRRDQPTDTWILHYKSQDPQQFISVF